MSPSKREREYARRRHEKWLERQQAAQARRRRSRWLAGIVLGVAVVGLAVAVTVVALNTGGSDDVAGTTPTDSTTASSETSPTASAPVPDPALAESRTWTGTIHTSVGDIGVTLDGAAAPQAVASFVSLARDSFFDQTVCHRLVTSGIFVLQCGDPTGTGSGGPGYSFGPVENAPADDVYPAGTIAMARRGGDASSMGSQFFLVYQDSTIPSDAAGGYTVFGHITSGLDVVQQVAAAGVEDGGSDGTPVTSVAIQGVELQ